MTETMSFLAGKSGDEETTTPDDQQFKALLPTTTPLTIPELHTNEAQPRPSTAKDPHIAMTTIIIVGCVITSCVLLALFVAALLRYKRSKVKRIEDDVHEPGQTQEQDKHDSADADIYAEIETKGHSCCFCLCRHDKYTVSSGEHIDNIYAEVSDVVPVSAPPAGKDVIYETLDGKDWSRSRSKSQGANDIRRCDKPPKIYDHLSFQELARLQLENPWPVPDRRKVSSSPDQMGTTYDKLDRSPQSMSTSDDLDDPDGNNNSLVRRLSQKQIMKKLFVVEREDTRRRRLRPSKRHDYFEVENASDSSAQPEYFVLDDVCRPDTDRHQAPAVPTRDCSVRSSVHGDRCVSFPCRPPQDATPIGRRVRSLPDNTNTSASSTSMDNFNSVPSVVSSEGVYNIQTGRAQRFSSDGQPNQPEYFELDPAIVSRESSNRSSGVQSEPGTGVTHGRADYFEVEPSDQSAGKSRCNDYFSLESETSDRTSGSPRFCIVENNVPTNNIRKFTRQISEPARLRPHGEGVKVVKLRAPESHDMQPTRNDDSIYDRIRLKSFAEEDSEKFRPRLFSTPNNIDY